MKGFTRVYSKLHIQNYAKHNIITPGLSLFKVNMRGTLGCIRNRKTEGKNYPKPQNRKNIRPKFGGGGGGGWGCHIKMNEGVVLRRWGSSIQKFGVINGVVPWPIYIINSVDKTKFLYAI